MRSGRQRAERRTARGRSGASWAARKSTWLARCTVERLLRELGIAGIAARKKRPGTTVPGPAGQQRPIDLLERYFTAPTPNRRWVADITYIETGIALSMPRSYSIYFPGWLSDGRSVTRSAPT
jgi:transposase InsO family protein